MMPLDGLPAGVVPAYGFIAVLVVIALLATMIFLPGRVRRLQRRVDELEERIDDLGADER